MKCEYLKDHYRKVYQEVSKILACTAETPPISDDDEITVQRLKMLVQSERKARDALEAMKSNSAADFEQWFLLGQEVEAFNSGIFSKDANGNYECYEVDIAWSAWKAARSFKE